MVKYNYQWSKTLRFGLNRKNDEKKYKSHQELGEFLKISEDKIITEVEKNNRNTIKETSDLLNFTECVLKDIEEYLENWKKINKRDDLLSFNFEFYKQLAKKGKFDAQWKIEEKRTKKTKTLPLTTKPVNLNSLKSKHNNKKRVDYIWDYWNRNFFETQQKYNELKLYLSEFQTAVNTNKTHQSLNLVEFRKICLQLFKLVYETLIPLYQDSITLGNKRNQLHEKDKFIGIFFDKLPNIYQKIEKLKTYFSENGGYVPLGRVTLNKKTAKQAPHKFDFEEVFKTNNFIKKKFIEELYKYVLDFEDYQDDEDKIKKAVELFFKNKNKKIDLYKDHRLCLLERTQYFKYQNIPLAVRFPLAEYLGKKYNWDKNILRKIFDCYGNPISLDAESKTLKENFKLENYPLKHAFDFAWNNAAKSIYYLNTNALLPHSKDFLDKIFDIKANNECLKLYAHLLEMTKNLAELDHQNHNENMMRDNIKYNAEKAIAELEKKDFIKKEYIQNIRERLKENKLYLKQEDLNKNFIRQYTEAKQKLGQLRAGQKLKIKKYKELTESFKEISRNYGNGFSSIREKLNEDTNLNKIDYLGVIIEDKNKDRYVLMHKLSDTRTEVEDLFQDEPNGEFTFYEVQSLTSKALEKLIKNPNSENAKNFHTSSLYFDLNKVKKQKEWENYKGNKEFLEYLKDCLKKSVMAIEQQWEDFGWDFSNCTNFDEIAKEVDRKSYRLKIGKISKKTIEEYINAGAFLLPIINQDITSQTKELKNQFSKDWQSIFKNELRLHPEFAISYRFATPNYPYPEEKRYSRFQLIGHLMAEYIPKEGNYLNRKEQIQQFNDQEKQKEYVKQINAAVKKNLGNEYFILGIDRGIKSLATLCVLNQKGQIQGGFKIYTRTAKYDKDNKFIRFEHIFLEERHILDLTNLRVETTVCIDNEEQKEQVLVDLLEIPVALSRDKEHKPKRDNNNEIIPKENNQKKKLKEMAYWRKVQFAFINNEINQSLFNYFEEKIEFLEGKQEINNNFFKEMPHISPYGEGAAFDDFPIERFKILALKFMKHYESDSLYQLVEELELDAVDNLKKGIVANMIGVVSFIIDQIYKKHQTIPLISMENLCRAWGYGVDGLTGELLPNSYHKSNKTGEKTTYKQQENLKLAGLGTYHFFEIQLLKKLAKLSIERNYSYNLVPPFRAVKDYEVVAKLTKLENNQYFCEEPFGIVYFVDPDHTSKACPCCENTTNIIRNKDYDEIECKKCDFITIWDLEQKENLTPTRKDQRYDINRINSSKEALIKYQKSGFNLHFIQNGDDNGAYHIAWKVRKKNEISTKKSKPQNA